MADILTFDIFFDKFPPKSGFQTKRRNMALKRHKGTSKNQRLLQKSSCNQNIYSTLFSLSWHIWQFRHVLAPDFVLLSDTSPSSWPWSLILSLVFFFFPLNLATLSVASLIMEIFYNTRCSASSAAQGCARMSKTNSYLFGICNTLLLLFLGQCLSNEIGCTFSISMIFQ